ncbi:MAG: hydroxyacylglutathione hydrolase [Desulforhopalus sp.]|jgi:hydroxyacylglutathione hydrolase
MKIEIIPCHFDNFSYLLICEESGKAAIVDPAEYYPISQVIDKLKVEIVAIYCTHHHADHIGGLDEFCEEYPDVQVAGFEGDAGRIALMTHRLKDGDVVEFGNIHGSVKHTPGHTSGGICFLFGEHLFTGDTLFGAGCGRLFEGTPEQMYRSLHSLTDDLDDGVKVYFGHEYTLSNLKFAQYIEPDNQVIADRLSAAGALLEKGGSTTPSTIGLEKKTNPFLRSNIDTVREGLAEKLLLDENDPVSVFTAVRRLKDSY